MPRPIRIGAVEYLNTKPLICDLEAIAPHAELILDLPSRLADRLATADLDVGHPVIEYFRGRNYVLIPDIAIASKGPVLSVTLFSKVPMSGAKTLALDVGSRTSVALTQVLLKHRFHANPELHPLPMAQPVEELNNDAVLLIGDRAMRCSLPGFPFSYDLGQEWDEWTGLPFVYAVWAVRPGVDLGMVPEALAEAKRRGRERMARSRILKRRGLASTRASVADTSRTSFTSTWARANLPACSGSTPGPRTGTRAGGSGDFVIQRSARSVTENGMRGGSQMATQRDALRDWHRLFGLLLTDFFTGTPFASRWNAISQCSSGSWTW